MLTSGPAKLEYDSSLKEPQSLKVNSTLILLVNVLGTPTPKVTWYYDDEQIYPSKDQVIEGDGTFSRLTVKNVNAKDAGSYRVEASNTIGTDLADFDIIIKG